MLPKPIHENVSLPSQILKLICCLVKDLAIHENLDVLAANYWLCILWMFDENCHIAHYECEVVSDGDDDDDNYT
jgi:hypothetical protein